MFVAKEIIYPVSAVVGMVGVFADRPDLVYLAVGAFLMCVGYERVFGSLQTFASEVLFFCAGAAVAHFGLIDEPWWYGGLLGLCWDNAFFALISLPSSIAAAKVAFRRRPASKPAAEAPAGASADPARPGAVKELLLNAGAFVVAWLGWIVSTYVLSYVLGLVLAIPVIGAFFAYPVDSMWAAQVIVNVFPVGLGMLAGMWCVKACGRRYGIYAYLVVIVALAVFTAVVGKQYLAPALSAVTAIILWGEVPEEL